MFDPANKNKSVMLTKEGLGGSAVNPDDTKLFITAEGLKGHCDSETLAVSVNGQIRQDAQITECGATNDCCGISLPINRQDMKSMQVAINIPGAQCSDKPLTLESSRHFCIRPTRFGGSEGCGY